MSDKKPTYKIAVNGRFLTQRLTGVQRYAYEIVTQLIQSDLEIVVLLPKEKINASYEVSGWPIVRLGPLNGQLWEQMSLPTFLYKNQINGSRYILLNLCNTAPIVYNKNVVTLHDLSFIENPTWFKKSFVLFYKNAIPVLLRNALMVSTVSQFSKETIKKYYPWIRKEIQVIYNAPTEFPLPLINDGSDLLEKHGLYPNKYILSVCSLEPRKNLNTLITSFSGLENKDISLVLVGGQGKVFSGVGLKTSSDSRIKLLGYVADDQLNILYEQALCFVYPSVYEGFGLPPIEAMSHSCPVMVSNIPPLKEVCGNAAVYFDPYSTGELLHKLESLIDNTSMQKELKVLGKARASMFNWKKSATKLETLLTNLINSDTRMD